MISSRRAVWAVFIGIIGFWCLAWGMYTLMSSFVRRHGAVNAKVLRTLADKLSRR